MEQLTYNKKISDFRIHFQQFKSIISVWEFKFTYYDCYAIHDYYPKSRFGYDVDQEIQSVRSLVYAFKEGEPKAIDYVSKIISTALKKLNIDLKDTCIAVIPSSEPEKTEKRFKLFCQNVSCTLGINDGYGSIFGAKREPTKGSSQKDLLSHFTFFNKTYMGLNVLLFDDVYTTGSSFKQVADRLIETGAQNVIGIFLAKTISD